jgi:hypothetical protein
VVINGCDSGAGNDLLPDGCTITDRIGSCASSAVTHEDFTSCVGHLAIDLFLNGVITARDIP